MKKPPMGGFFISVAPLVLNITSLGRTAEMASARFCAVRAVSGTFPHPDPQKSPLVSFDRLHGYARK